MSLDRGRVVTLANGRRLVFRSGTVFARDTDDADWSPVFTPPAGPRVLARDAVDRLVLTDGATTSESLDFGDSWHEGELPTHLVDLSVALDAPLADLLLDLPSGIPVAVWTVDGSLSWVTGSLPDANRLSWFHLSGEPNVWLDPDGFAVFPGRTTAHYFAGQPTGDGPWYEYSNAGFSGHYQPLHGLAASVTGPRLWVWSQDSEVRFAVRARAYAGPLLATGLVAAVDADVAPYVVELADGRIECGWLDGLGDWVRYRASLSGADWELV